MEDSMKKTAFAFHTALIILEIAALVHDLQSFGLGMFKYYTIDSNLLQLAVSALSLLYLWKKTPNWLLTLHLVCAVCLTITFMIAAAVLAPQEGFAYYFLSDVAPINHFLAPVLSVVTFILMSGSDPLPKKAALAPMGATLFYGVIALGLNAAQIIDGPYFFLRVYVENPRTIVMWFAIIAVLCLVLGFAYWHFRQKRASRR